MKEGRFEQPGYCDHGNANGSCEICAARASMQEDLHEGDEVGEKEQSNPAEEALVVSPEMRGEQWMRISEIADTLGRDWSTVKTAARPYRTTHPEWFAMRPLNGLHGKPTEYFAPQLVALLRRKFEKIPDAPPGWLTSAQVAVLKGSHTSTVSQIANKYRDGHSEWFVTLRHKNGKTFEHFAPELTALIAAELTQHKTVPNGWMTEKETADQLAVTSHVVSRITGQLRLMHPEWFGYYRSPRNRVFEYFSPEAIARIASEITQEKVEPKAVKTTPFAPPDWQMAESLAHTLTVGTRTIAQLAEQYRDQHPDWYRRFRIPGTKRGHSEFYAPELIARVTHDVRDRPTLPPDGWKTQNQVSVEFSKTGGAIATIAESHRIARPGWFHVYLDGAGKASEHYAPQLVGAIRRELESRVQTPGGWVNTNSLVHELGRSFRTVQRAADRYRASNPEWFQNFYDASGRSNEHYAPQLVALIREEMQQRQKEKAPPGWVTLTEASAHIGVHATTLASRLDQYREREPGWFHQYRNKAGLLSEYFAPGLIAAVVPLFETNPSLRRKRVQEAETIFQRLASPATHDGQQFRSLATIFGSSHALDLLYRLHPSFKSVPADRVSGMLAQYLGDFLLLQTQFSLDGIEEVENLGAFLTDEDLRAGFLEVVKGSCLTFYQKEWRADPEKDPRVIIQDYFASVRQQLAKAGVSSADSVVDEAETYYAALYTEFEKPNTIVAQLRAGRVFPDINQRINIKEVQDKQRVLIGDEMGLGKSASAILSKEYLGVRCALVVAPSNVIPTWQEYLSDRQGDDGRQIGYFTSGNAPRVLTVRSVEDLHDIGQSAYDYVLLAQERLNERHMHHLDALSYDMLIVDEVHKLKNVSTGKRSRHIVDLARRLDGKDQYVVMLSGTPVPNKVGDSALLLKMLYPEKFEAVEDDDLVRSIIHGDVVEIRNLLIPRMQVKRLQESLDMPPLQEVNVPVTLSEAEEEMYEVLLEEDELTAAEKITALRQFLLNPELLDVAPEIPGAKILALQREVADALMHHDTVIIFVNGYVQDVIRGEHAILQKLQVPGNVDLHVIDGSTPQDERLHIQRMVQHHEGKLLVAVSGQTADVGVNFSHADHVLFYNEPWTAFDKQQQLGRVYREGHETSLASRTLITSKTIEDGIHLYITAKRNAIEKVLRGIPRTEMENRLLEQDERQMDENLEVNPHLAEYYFSAWDRMLRIFGHVREIGEAEFKSFLDTHAEEYADCYAELGSRTYQANNSRVVGSLMAEMAGTAKHDNDTLRILDLGSGPEMLRKHLGDSLQGAVISLDINQHHFTAGSGSKVVASFTQLPHPSNSMDYCNLALSLHYTKFLPSRGEYERVRVFTEMNRVLKVGGRAVISMIYTIDWKDRDAAQKAFAALGFRIVDEYTGDAESGEKYQAHITTLEKISDVPEMQNAGSRGLDATVERVTPKTLGGLKFKRTKGLRLKNSRRIIDGATLTTTQGNKDIPIVFNQRDLRIRQEEQAILAEGRALVGRYHGAENIPVATLQQQGFARLTAGKRCILFKKLIHGEGAVIVR